MFKSFLQRMSLVVGVLAFVLSAAAGYSYFFRQPFVASSLVEVSGRVSEVAELTSSRSDARFVELRLEGEPRLFRLPIDAYEMVPNHASFLADLQSRPVATLGVDSASFLNPFRPITGERQPATFVTTIATTSRAYVTALDWVRWHHEDRKAAGQLALLMLACGCVLLFGRNIFP